MADAVQPRFVSLAADSRPEPRTAFEMALHKFLDDLFEAEPVWATSTGFHRFDDRWPDASEAGRQARLAMLRHHRARFAALEPSELSRAEAIDLGVVLEAIDAMEFGEAALREAAWDPLSHVAVAGSGLFDLLAREFAPWAHRGQAFVGRMNRLPEYLRQAADVLVGLPDRPVSRLHTDTALEQLVGVSDLLAEGAAEAERRAAAGEEPELARQIEAALPGARAAIDDYRRALEGEIGGRAEGEGRLGGDLFAAKLRHTLASNISPAELLARAERDYDLVRAEMVRLARQLWPRLLPDQPLPDVASAGTPAAADNEVVRRVLDVIAHEHPRPEELLDWCRAEVARIEEFCRSRELIGLPDEPLQITWTPVFMRAYGGAFLASPGPLDKGLSSYFWITPPDESRGPEAVESYMREDNERMLRLLCIHEAIPGHYLQLAWSNRSPSLARAVFYSGMFAEGWAVYVTQVMMDVGYGGADPALLLTNWKFYLRAVINAIIDVRIHTAGMSEQEAMTMMVEGGFQEEHEARQKWLRARLTSTQLSTYYLGSLEMWAIEEEARRRAARAVGADESAVPGQRIAGGLGETPGFDYRRHLESVIAHGTPPIKWVRQILASAEPAAHGAG
ncbi:MAG: DUF885 domain-containing protein [Chloroflexota bacterium]|nr:DUF885 domain-containing protein [Chloroflexota bacterium]